MPGCFRALSAAPAAKKGSSRRDPETAPHRGEFCELQNDPYAPNKIETAEWLSRMAGAATIVKEDITQSGGRFAAILKNVSKTYHQVGRPLATADEIMRLKAPAKDKGDIITEPGDMLVFVAGHAPIFGTQSLYFRDPVFLARASLPPPPGNSPIGAAAIPPFKL